jgi:hypothetical protein
MAACLSRGMTRSSIRSQWTMICSPSCSSAWESMVWSSLRMRPESEIFTGRVRWSTPEMKRTSSGLKTWRTSSIGSMKRKVKVMRAEAWRVASSVVTL